MGRNYKTNSGLVKVASLWKDKRKHGEQAGEIVIKGQSVKDAQEHWQAIAANPMDFQIFLFKNDFKKKQGGNAPDFHIYIKPKKQSASEVAGDYDPFSDDL